MEITLYREIVVKRLLHFLNKTTNLAQGKTEVIDDRKICMWNEADDEALIKQAIAQFHKSVDKVTPEEPLEVTDFINFLGSSNLTATRASQHVDMNYMEYSTITGIQTLVFEKDNNTVYVPAIFLYVDAVPHILVPKSGFCVGSMLQDTYTPQDVLYLPFTDDILPKIANFVFNNIESEKEEHLPFDVDLKMIDILLRLKSENIAKREPSLDVTEVIKRLGYNPSVVDLLPNFLMVPILKFDEHGISDILVTNQGVYNSITWDEYIESNIASAVVLVNEHSNEYTLTINNDPFLYNFSGKNYYLDDTGYEKNSNGGYKRTYRVYAEEFSPISVHYGIQYEMVHKDPAGEAVMVDAVKKIKKIASDLSAEIKKNKNKKEMYKLFESEVYDLQVQIKNTFKMIYLAREGKKLGQFMSKSDTGALVGAATGSIVAYSMLPKEKRTDEGLAKITDFYNRELESVMTRYNDAKSKKHFWKLPFINMEKGAIEKILKRIDKETKRREKKAQGEGFLSNLFRGKNDKSKIDPKKAREINDAKLKETKLGKINEYMSDIIFNVHDVVYEGYGFNKFVENITSGKYSEFPKIDEVEILNEVKEHLEAGDVKYEYEDWISPLPDESMRQKTKYVQHGYAELYHNMTEYIYTEEFVDMLLEDNNDEGHTEESIKKAFPVLKKWFAKFDKEFYPKWKSINEKVEKLVSQASGEGFISDLFKGKPKKKILSYEEKKERIERYKTTKLSEVNLFMMDAIMTTHEVVVDGDSYADMIYYLQKGDLAPSNIPEVDEDAILKEVAEHLDSGYLDYEPEDWYMFPNKNIRQNNNSKIGYGRFISQIDYLTGPNVRMDRGEDFFEGFDFNEGSAIIKKWFKKIDTDFYPKWKSINEKVEKLVKAKK